MKLHLTILLFAVKCMICWCEQDFVVTNEDVEPFKGSMETLVDMSNIQTVSREKYFNGSFSFLADLNNEEFKFSVELFSSPKGDGDYKRLAAGVPNTAICEGFKKFYVQFIEPGMIQDVITNFPVIGDDGLCPLPKGTFFLKELVLDTESWPNQAPRGIIKAVITFYKNDVPVGGANFIVKIEDRE